VLAASRRAVRAGAELLALSLKFTGFVETGSFVNHRGARFARRAAESEPTVIRVSGASLSLELGATLSLELAA